MTPDTPHDCRHRIPFRSQAAKRDYLFKLTVARPLGVHDDSVFSQTGRLDGKAR